MGLPCGRELNRATQGLSPLSPVSPVLEGEGGAPGPGHAREVSRDTDTTATTGSAAINIGFESISSGGASRYSPRNYLGLESATNIPLLPDGTEQSTGGIYTAPGAAADAEGISTTGDDAEVRK